MVKGRTNLIATALMTLVSLAVATPQTCLAEDASGHDANGHRPAVHTAPKFRPNVMRQALPVPAAAGTVGAESRNAIGVSVPAAATRTSTPPVPSNPASGLQGVSGNRVGLAEPIGPRPGFVVVTPAAPASHGAINGTVLIRRSSAPTPLGGPAKSMTAINGTIWQAKH